MSRVRTACLSAVTLSAALAAAAHAQIADRYGPAAPSYGDGATAQTTPAQPSSGRLLSWPGKTSLSSLMAPVGAPVMAQSETLGRRSSSMLIARSKMMAAKSAPIAVLRPAAPYAVAQRVNEPLPPSSALNPHYGLVQAAPSIHGAPQLAGAPTPAPSIYDPATTSIQRQATPTPEPVMGVSTPPRTQTAADPAHPGWAPPRRAWSQAGDTGVRFYSLHRQYGVQPDPAPIPPQFFSSTADVTDPAGPTARTVAGAGAAAQAARALQASNADTASSQP